MDVGRHEYDLHAPVSVEQRHAVPDFFKSGADGSNTFGSGGFSARLYGHAERVARQCDVKRCIEEYAYRGGASRQLCQRQPFC